MERDIEQAKKEVEIERLDIITLESSHKGGDSEFETILTDETERLEREFDRMNNIDKAEADYIRSQINQLNQDKFRTNQNLALLEERIRQTDIDIGFKYAFE